MAELQEPKGIGFFNIKSGETHYLKLEAQIQAYINSSDMGINASRGQDFGWRLDPEWVKRVKAFRRDATQMSILASKNSGQKPTTVQILYYLYGEQLRAFEEVLEENENPYEEQYLQDISSNPQRHAPANTPGTQTVPETVAEADLVPAEEIDVDAAAEAATSDEPVKSKSQQRREAAIKQEK